MAASSPEEVITGRRIESAPESFLPTPEVFEPEASFTHDGYGNGQHAPEAAVEPDLAPVEPPPSFVEEPPSSFVEEPTPAFAEEPPSAFAEEISAPTEGEALQLAPEIAEEQATTAESPTFETPPIAESESWPEIAPEPIAAAELEAERDHVVNARQRLQDEQKDWELKNEQLQLELAKMQSLPWVEARASQLGMRQPEQTVTIQVKLPAPTSEAHGSR